MTQHAYTLTALAAAISEGLAPTYELVYVDRNDQLTDTQVDAVLRGDTETLDESIDEWHSDQQYDAARQIITELQQGIIAEWFHDLDPDDEDYDRDYGRVSQADDEFYGSDEWDELRMDLQERDTSNPITELARKTPDVLLRVSVPALDEDAGLSFTDVSPEQVLDGLGFEHSAENVTAVANTLLEVSAEFSVVMGYLVLGADVAEMLAMTVDTDAQVRIENPHLYLGNPFSGSGWLSEQLQGTFTCTRGELRTDRKAFGYSVQEIFGGLNASEFAASITAVEQVSA